MDSYEAWLQDVRKRLAAAVADAAPMVDAGRFDEAERLVRAVNDDIYGAVALGELFTGALQRMARGQQVDRARAEAVYERALRWRSAWPGVHTAEEAAAERAHGEAVRRELGALLALVPEA